MKARIALATTWFGSNNNAVKTVIRFSVLAMTLIAASIAGAGPMPGGPDVP